MNKWLQNIRIKATRNSGNKDSVEKYADDTFPEIDQISGIFENKRMFKAWAFATLFLFFAFLFSFFVYFSEQKNIDERFEKSPKYYNLRYAHDDRDSNPYLLLFVSSCVLLSGSIANVALVYSKPTKVTITKSNKSYLLRIEGSFFKTPKMNIEKTGVFQLLEHRRAFFTPVYLVLSFITCKGEYILGDFLPDSRNYGFPQYDAGEFTIQLQSKEEETVYNMARFLGLAGK